MSSAADTGNATSVVASVPVMQTGGVITVVGRSAQVQCLRVPTLWKPSLLDGQLLHAITVASV